MKSFSEFNGIFLPLLHIFKSSKIIYLNNVTLTHNLTFSSHTHFYRPFHQNHTPACLSVLNSLQDKPPHPMFVLVKHRTTLALQIRVYWKKKRNLKNICELYPLEETRQNLQYPNTLHILPNTITSRRQGFKQSIYSYKFSSIN